MELTSIRNTSHKRNIPIISLNTEEFLKNILNDYCPHKCLEVGSCIGYSSIFISRIINKRGGNMISFEISYPSYKQALNNIKAFNLANLSIYNLDFGVTPLNKLIEKGSLDFIFIDAMKKDYLKYYMLCRPFMSKNCIIIFDDVIKYGDKMTNLYTFLKKNQMNYQLLQLDEDDGVIIVKP